MTTQTNKTGGTTETVRPEAATMEQFMATPYYQGLEIEALRKQLAGYEADDETLRQQAEAEYRPAYEMETEGVRQKTQRQIQGYDSQREGVSAAYDRLRSKTNAAYDESHADLNNSLTRRGLGRSSLVSTQGAYLENQRNQALADIGRDENAEIAAINEKIALLTDQSAQNERTLAGNYARQLDNRVNELREKNKSAAVDLQLQIAALQQQGYEAYQDWLKSAREHELKERQQALKEQEFDEKYGGEPAASGSAGGGSGSGKKESAPAQTGGQKQAAAGQAEKVGGVLTTLLEDIRKKLSQARGGTSGTGGTTAAKASAAKRQAARE